MTRTLPDGMIDDFFGFHSGRLADHVARFQKILDQYPDAYLRFSVGDDAYNLFSSEAAADEHDRAEQREELMKRHADAQRVADEIKAKLDDI